MRRRTYLGALGGAAATALAGCLGGFRTADAYSPPPLVADRPDAVYHPTHRDGMVMVGAAESGGQRLALTFTYPHRFWTMEAATGTTRVDIADDDTLHMMASVFYPESGVYVTDAAPTVSVSKGGEAVVGPTNPWAMLSQTMGFHYGDNLALDGEGTYSVTVRTGAPTARRTGALRGVGGRGTFEFEFELTGSTMGDLTVTTFPDREGTRGAVAPMDMSIPFAVAPRAADLPGAVLGTATSGDARLVATLSTDPPEGVEGEAYLAVSPRTPYNRFVIPGMTLDATVDGGARGSLVPTLDPDLGFHYGVALDAPSPSEVTVEVVSPPQVARHEGYETAFVEMPPVTFPARG
jgi:hypothetical protein